ncbi:TPA: peptidylprolyl isomerase [Streptococcus suis]|nr:peptidylprolyl isomerase [Streptococcus suis]
MYNKAKIKGLIALGLLALVGFVSMIGYTLGSQLTLHQATQQAEKNATSILEEKAQAEAAKTLTPELVTDFLIQYYTKAKLGENNNRIKSFMTDAAYSEELTKQELAVNQVNKEFIVDYIYEDATIFINSKDKEVIVEVSYNVTYLSEITGGQQYKNTQLEKATVKLSYSEVSEKLLVNHIQTWKIGLSDMADGGENFLKQQGLSGSDSSTPVPSNEIEATDTQ